MAVDHDSFVVAAEAFSLLIFVAMSIAVVIYAYRPRKKLPFKRAAEAVLDDEDRPWR